MYNQKNPNWVIPTRPPGTKDNSAASTAFVNAALTSVYTAFTPGLTFVTPGDLNVAYAFQYGAYRTIGNLVYVDFDIQTSTFTHSTSAGNLLIANLPIQAFGQIDLADPAYRSNIFQYSGINKVGYAALCGDIFTGGFEIYLSACGMGVPLDNLVAADVPSGGTVILKGAAIYFSS